MFMHALDVAERRAISLPKCFYLNTLALKPISISSLSFIYIYIYIPINENDKNRIHELMRLKKEKKMTKVEVE